MRQRDVRQGKLFEVNKSVHVPPLQKEVEQEAIRELVQLLRALAKIIDGVGNEQDKR
jgi:hypothetical protein